MLAPAVSASPIAPSLGWTSQNLVAGQSTTATFGVLADADCPIGQTFSGTLTVVRPDASSGSVSVTGIACGTTTTAAYPIAFSGTAGTNLMGTYTATWAGTTTTTVLGVHPTFSVQDNLVVKEFPPPVPEFSAPALLVAAIGLALFAVVKKGNILKVPAA